MRYYIFTPALRRTLWGRVILFVALVQPCAVKSVATETCHFNGTTDYAGHVSVSTSATTADDTVRVGVTLRFEATTTLWLHLQYLVEEDSEWRHGMLQRLNVNTRYIFAGHVVRQQWDEFRLTNEGLHAYRIEGKRSAQFRRQFPAFAEHWELTTFGLPWLDDYALAAPDRRPDLDLKGARSGGMHSPFALAFYWVRFLHTGDQSAQVFLPGFKADKLADLTMTAAPTSRGRTWRATLQHPYLRASPPSTAIAMISADGHLQLLSFELHGSAGSAGGTVHQDGCTGTVAR